jgi:hypothetical protein
MLSAIMLSAIMLNVVMLSVVAPFCYSIESQKVKERKKPYQSNDFPTIRL